MAIKIKMFIRRFALAIALVSGGGPAYAQLEAIPPENAPKQLEAADVSTAKEVTPAPADAAADSKEETTTTKPAKRAEVVRERYPSGAVKIERAVSLDADGNYVNNGKWTMYDEKGSVLSTGSYNMGKRDGKWVRWYGEAEAAHFSGPLYKEFQRPLATEATFSNDVMQGTWRIFDSKNRKVCELEFTDGERHGRSTWWYASGQKHREVNFKHDELDGDVIEWGADYKPVVRESYIAGRRLATQTEFYSPGVKKTEGKMLMPREIVKSNYDWWNGILESTVVGKEGVSQRTGEWTHWHRNGQKMMEGRYEDNLSTGKFTWWYDNGQEQLEGDYAAGKQTGLFTWWHANGQKQCEGNYTEGVQSGKWMRWETDGKLAEMGDYTIPGHPVEAPKIEGSAVTTASATTPVTPASPVTGKGGLKVLVK